MILVDSSVWIDYFRGAETTEADRLHDLLGRAPVGIGDLVLTEVLQGFASDRDFDRALLLLQAFPVVSIGDGDIAVQAARNFSGGFALLQTF